MRSFSRVYQGSEWRLSDCTHTALPGRHFSLAPWGRPTPTWHRYQAAGANKAGSGSGCRNNISGTSCGPLTKQRTLTRASYYTYNVRIVRAANVPATYVCCQGAPHLCGLAIARRHALASTGRDEDRRRRDTQTDGPPPRKLRWARHVRTVTADASASRRRIRGESARL